MRLRNEGLTTICDGNPVSPELKRKEAISMGSERPENDPVDRFQWRTGGSPGKGVATIELAERRNNDCQ